MKRADHPAPLWVKLSLGILGLFLLFSWLMGSFVILAYQRQRLGAEMQHLADRSQKMTTEAVMALSDFSAGQIFWQILRKRNPGEKLGSTETIDSDFRKKYVQLDFYLKKSPYRDVQLSICLPAGERLLDTASLPTYALTESRVRGSHLLWASQLLYLDGHPLYFNLSADLKALDEELQSLRRAFLFASLPLFPLAAILIYFLTRHATLDLKKLAKAAATYRVGENKGRLKLSGSRETRQLSEQLQTMWQQLEEQYALLQAEKKREEEFSLALSHELKNPLASQLLHLDLLEEPTLPPEIRKISLRWIRQSAEDMEQLREHMLHLYIREESVRKEELELAAWLKEWQSEESEKRSVPLIYRQESPMPVTVMADPILLSRLLENLIDNAETALLSRLDAEKQQETMIELVLSGTSLSVVDHGPGVSAEARARLTELFYRQDPSRDRKERHHGIGLAFCPRVCEWHGWTLRFSETPGGGLTVSLCFTEAAGKTKRLYSKS